MSHVNTTTSYPRDSAQWDAEGGGGGSAKPEHEEAIDVQERRAVIAAPRHGNKMPVAIGNLHARALQAPSTGSKKICSSQLSVVS